MVAPMRGGVGVVPTVALVMASTVGRREKKRRVCASEALPRESETGSSATSYSTSAMSGSWGMSRKRVGDSWTTVDGRLVNGLTVLTLRPPLGMVVGSSKSTTMERNRLSCMAGPTEKFTRGPERSTISTAVSAVYV